MLCDLLGIAQLTDKTLSQKELLKYRELLLILCYIIFLFDSGAHLERYILLKTPPKSNQWFQSYEQLKDSQNYRKQKKFIPLSGYSSISMLPSSDCFHQIITQNGPSVVYYDTHEVHSTMWNYGTTGRYLPW